MISSFLNNKIGYIKGVVRDNDPLKFFDAYTVRYFIAIITFFVDIVITM